MQPNAPCGLLKFFDDEQRLDELIAGRVYCNTPAYYRAHGAQGIGDRYESVSWAFRKDLGDPHPELKIGDREIGDLETMEIRGTGMKDQWLHCWMVLRFPGDPAALRKLCADLERMRAEFGKHCAFVQPGHVDELLRRLDKSTTNPMKCAEVTYSDDLLKQSPICKGEPYRYQREWRILLGDCGNNSEKELDFIIKGGLGDLVTKSPHIRLFNSKNNETLLELDWAGRVSCKELNSEI